MANLYDIDQKLQMLENYGCDEDGVILSEEEFIEMYESIQMDLNDKIENTICFVKNLTSDVKALKEEEDKLKKRRQMKENLAERLKTRIDSYIKYQHTNEDGELDRKALNSFKMETPKMSISYRKSVVADITNLSQVPSEFIKPHEITEKDVDKAGIKKIMLDKLKELNKDKTKTDEQLDYELPYAKLITNINMGIK